MGRKLCNGPWSYEVIFEGVGSTDGIIGKESGKMRDGCNHDYEVSFRIIRGTTCKCRICGDTLKMKRKYACFLYTVSSVGWVLYFFLTPTILSFLTLMLIGCIYLLTISMIEYMFFVWIKKKDKHERLKYFDGY